MVAGSSTSLSLAGPTVRDRRRIPLGLSSDIRIVIHEVVADRGQSTFLDRQTRMGKNIVVCCDGTNSQFGGLSTNVVHLYNALDQDTPGQRSFYEPGVGTFGAPVLGVKVGETVGKALGAAFGYGITRNLVRAYRFLIDSHEAGDRLFLFGFSRGAFTARTLAALVDRVGVLPASHRDRAETVVKAYLDQDSRALNENAAAASRCAPQFVGVWETVGALGLLIRLRRFHDHRLSPGVARAAQALAIDERRRKFEPTLWNESALAPDQQVRQVWFPGVHSDIGGGYAQRGLADITLQWMLTEARAAGIGLAPGALDSRAGDATGTLHRSYRGLWRLLGRHVRRPKARATFHGAVGERLRRCAHYVPRNLSARTRSALRRGDRGDADSAPTGA